MQHVCFYSTPCFPLSYAAAACMIPYYDVFLLVYKPNKHHNNPLKLFIFNIKI